MSSKKEMPKEFKLLIEWQKILGLQDWKILLRTNCEKKDLTLDYAEGEVQYEETTKSAEIRVLNEKECCSAFRKFDFEEVLVHELLHLKTCLLTEGDDWENCLQLRVLHQTIDDLARAFVEVKRKGEKK